MEKKKNVAILAVLAVLLLGLSLLQLLPDKEVSTAERRKLAQMPELSAQSLTNGTFSTGLESYLLDQFPARESFRSLKALSQFYVLWQSDSNGIYLQDGSAVKMEYPLSEEQVQYAADKLQSVIDTQLGGCNVYYAVVPDKNYYAAAKSGHLQLDYGRIDELLAKTLTAKEIRLYDTLSLEDYYDTDAHWRQESIMKTAERLAQEMGAGESFVPLSEYTVHDFSPFYGVYYGQSALPLQPDTLRYLTSRQTEAAAVTSVEQDGTQRVYELANLQNPDSYDVFLSGAQALLEIEVKDAQTDRELIIFRDSYGSSLAPLLLGAYSKITLVDLRYIPAELLPEYLNIHGQDVLLLLSSTVLNSGRLLR